MLKGKELLKGSRLQLLLIFVVIAVTWVASRSRGSLSLFSSMTSSTATASATNGFAGAAALLPCTTKSYDVFIDELLDDTLGPFMKDAIYDPEWLNEAATTTSEEAEDTHVWVASDMRAQPIPPSSFFTFGQVVWMTKRDISIGIARFHRDQSMSDLYHRSCSMGPLAIGVFERSARRVIEAFAKQFHTAVQIGVQVSRDALVKVLLHISNAARVHGGEDPVLIISSWVTHATAIGAIDSEIQDPNAISNFVQRCWHLYQKSHPSSTTDLGSRRMKHLFPLWYDEPPHDMQHPVSGKFWNMIRPTTSCSSVVRLCELPEGCRLICNAEYLLYAGVEHGASYAHRLAGFGCNNDYEWELSIHRLFSDVAIRHRNKAHSVGWLTIFDCTMTVQPGPREWRPPQVLSHASMGFGFAPLCLDGKKSETSIGPLEIKPLLLKSEEHAKKGMPFDAVRVQWLNPVAVAAEEDQHVHIRSPHRYGVNYFDGISFLKIDIEGFEHAFVPSWAREELRDVARNVPHLVQRGSRALIDFDSAAKTLFTVSLFSWELHRMGHAAAMAGLQNGTLRSQYTLLRMYSLGFLMITAEKNPFDDCCYEHVWAHYRYFMKSELWMVTREL